MYSTKLVNPKASGFVANTDKTPFNAPGEAYKDPNRGELGYSRILS